MFESYVKSGSVPYSPVNGSGGSDGGDGAVANAFFFSIFENFMSFNFFFFEK